MSNDGRDREVPGGSAAGPADAGSSARPASARPEDSVGEYLARQRRLRGISIDELCERTRIPRRNLERLEAGAFDEQRDGFARGFVRTVAHALGLDADEAVMRLMREPSAGEERRAGSDLRVALQRFGAAALIALGLLALWSAVSALRGADAPEPDAPAVVYRADVVRQLAEQAAPQPAAAASAEPAPASPPAPPAP